jgi:hypothetical protein
MEINNFTFFLAYYSKSTSDLRKNRKCTEGIISNIFIAFGVEEEDGKNDYINPSQNLFFSKFLTFPLLAVCAPADQRIFMARFTTGYFKFANCGGD